MKFIEESEGATPQANDNDPSPNDTDIITSFTANMPNADQHQITDSITADFIDTFQPVHKRYFDEKYCTRFSTESRNLDTCIRVHSNKICVVYISNKHSLFVKKQTVKRLNFQVSSKTNRLDNVMSGKGKRGAQFLAPDSILCVVETEDGESYPVHAGINGKLLEINSQLVDNPSLIVDDNLSCGFVAIMLCDLRRFKDNILALVSQANYDEEEATN